MKNNRILILVIPLFLILLVTRADAATKPVTKDYCQVPKNHVVLAYSADLGRKFIGKLEHTIGQGVYDPTLDLLKQEGYEIITIYDPLNGGKFIEFKKAWEENPGGIALYLNHGMGFYHGAPSHVVIGMFDNWGLVREFLKQLKNLGFTKDDYFVSTGWYWAIYVTSANPTTDDDISWPDSWEKKIYSVNLNLQGLNKFRDKKDLVIWSPCIGDATQEHIPANIVCFRQGVNNVPFVQESTKILFEAMSGDQGTKNLAFTKAFKFINNPSFFREGEQEGYLFGLIKRTKIEKYDYSGPHDGVDLVLNPAIDRITYVDDTRADIRFATKMRTQEYSLGDRPVFLQEGSSNAAGASVVYDDPIHKPHWIDDQTLRFSIKWGRYVPAPRWAQVIVDAHYFLAKDNPYFFLNGRRYVAQGLDEHDGDGCRGYRPLGKNLYVPEADFLDYDLGGDYDWFWISEGITPGKGEISNNQPAAIK